MKVKDADIIFIAGDPVVDEGHWLARWQSKLSTGRRLTIGGGDATDETTRQVVDAVDKATRPVVLVAHGEAVPVIVRAAGKFTARIAGAFMVAPSTTNSAPLPHDPLPFPSLLVASRDDPNCDFSTAEELGAGWGSLFIDAGNAGGLNVASGHGPWPEGSMTFARFVSRLQ
ncbi:MAG: serine hydrolase family protein [Rhizobiaceae bacterium]|nr:serine hydrolase family protein [Rhizobiaceae bacterium]